MSSLCTCATQYGNTGNTNCRTIFGVARDFWIVPMTDSTNAANSILNSATLDQAYFIGKFNDNDREDRFYPLRRVKQYEPTKQDPKLFEWDDGTKERLAEGVRTFAFMLDEYEFGIIKNLMQSGCSDIGVYLRDENNNIAGNGRLTDRLLPLRISVASFNAQAQLKTDAQPYGVMVTFDLAIGELDQDIRVIAGSDLATDVDFEAFGLQGLLDINATVSGITTTTFDALLEFQYGSHRNLQKFTNGVLADFTLFNDTDSASVTITSVDTSDAANGNYIDFTYAIQDSADSMTLSIEPETKNGYELTKSGILIP